MSVLISMTRRQCHYCHRWLYTTEYPVGGRVCWDCLTAGAEEPEEESND